MFLNRNFFNSLMVQLALFIMSVTSVVLLVSGIYLYSRDASELEEALRDESQWLVENLAENLSRPIYNYNDATVKIICRSAMSRREIIGVKLIYDADKLLEIHRDEEGEPISWEQLIAVDHNFTVSNPIMGVEKQLGSIQLTGVERQLGSIQLVVTRRYLNESLRSILLFNVATLLILAVVLVVLITILLRFRFVRPLEELVKTSSLMANGDLDTVIRAPATAEFRSLATGMDTMRNNIKGHVEELRRHKEDLEAIVKERTHELECSNAELEQFASVASHDLQEPLRKILAFGSRLESKCNDSLDEAGKDYLARMQNAATRMQNLIRGLLSLSRVSSKGCPFEPVRLNDVFNILIDDLEIQIADSNAKVDVSDLPVINGDETQMRQLFQNILVNAMKYVEPGKVPHVSVSCSTINKAGNKFNQIVVADKGIGFEQKYAERIFGVFQRLHGKGEYVGTGIGLAICQKIVDRHGGSISAVSEPGVETKFIIQLPTVESCS